MAVRNISAAMQSHLNNTVTTLSVCVSITPSQETLSPSRYLTQHNEDITYLNNTYSASSGMEISNISTSIDFTSDNTEIRIPLLTTDNATLEVENLLDSDVKIFMLNWKDISMGEISLFTGYVSSAEYEKSSDTYEIRLTISGVLARKAKQKLPRYSRTCRTKLGSPKCGVPIQPVNRVDVYRSFPKDFVVGYQGYDIPLTAAAATLDFNSWSIVNGTFNLTDPVITYPDTNTEDGEISLEIDKPVSASVGDIFVLKLDTASTSFDYTVSFEQLNSASEIVQVFSHKFIDGYTHNLSLLMHPDTDKFRVILKSKSGQTTTFNSVTMDFFGIAELDRTIHKLARVTNQANQNRIIVPNGQFYKDGFLSSSCNLSQLSNWSGTCNGFYTVAPGIGFTGNDVTIEQTVELPVMGCTLVTSGCYYMDIIIPHSGTGILTTTVELQDIDGTVLQTETTTLQNLRFQVDPNTSLHQFKIKHEFDNTGNTVLSESKVYLINSTISAAVDPDSVLLTNIGDIETLNDIWYIETIDKFYKTSVDVPDTLFPNISFSIPSGTVGPTNTTYGEILFVTGQNSGIKREIRFFNESSNNLELYKELPYPTVSGDEFIISLFCDKTIQTCGLTFNNAVNFRGEPYLPGPEKLNEIIGV